MCVCQLDCLNPAITGFPHSVCSALPVPMAAQVDQDGHVDLQWLSWIGEPEATRSRMVVDNLLGRGADHLDASESSVDNPDFRRALLAGWQRLEGVIERNFRMEQFVVIHLHWAPVVAVSARALCLPRFTITHSPSVNCAPPLCPQALIGAEQGTFDLNAIDNRKRGFGSAGPQRPNPSCVARGPFHDVASIRCYVMIGGRKVRVPLPTLIAHLLMFLVQPPSPSVLFHHHHVRAPKVGRVRACQGADPPCAPRHPFYPRRL